MKLMTLAAFLVATLAVDVTHAQSELAIPTVTAPQPAHKDDDTAAQPMVPLAVAKQYAAQYELRLVDSELARLRAERPRILWPIALVATGATITVIHGAMAIYNASTWQREGYRWDEEGNRYKVEWRDKTQRNDARDGGIGVAIGLSIAGLGLVFLRPRVEKRRELSKQARALKERRTQLVRELSLNLSMNASSHHGTVATTIHF